MDFQPLFRRFHQNIELTYKGSAELREMRDETLNLLQQRLDEAKRPRLQFFNQGSYEMGTGIKPQPGADYDIDVAVVFPLERARYQAKEVKGWVYQALANTGKVEWRHPCITVSRKRYHLDLVVMVKDNGHYLSLGKEHAADILWQPDERDRFIKEVANRFPDVPDDGFQLRRVVRYLKRWKDLHFPKDGKSAPTGHALTVMAYKWFRPCRRGAVYDDLRAVQTLIAEILRNFAGDRLDLRFPFQPKDDVFAKMSTEQQRQVRIRLEKLQGMLAEAEKSGTTAALVRAFGPDFPTS